MKFLSHEIGSLNYHITLKFDKHLGSSTAEPPEGTRASAAISLTDFSTTYSSPLEELNWSWWHHQMETFSALLALCKGNPLVMDRFPSQRPVTRNFDVFFDLHLNKQSRDWWFEEPLCSLWSHCNEFLWFVCFICLFTNNFFKQMICHLPWTKKKSCFIFAVLTSWQWLNLL